MKDMQVTGAWSGPVTGTVTGYTNPTGKVTLHAPPISDESVTFTVTSVVGPGYEYRSDLNVVEAVVVTRPDAS